MNTSDIRQSLYQCLIQEVAIDSFNKYIDLFAITPGKSFRINLYIETEEAQPDIIGITFASGTSPITVGGNLIQNVPFFKVIQANINDDSGSSNYNFYYYDADDSLRHYYLSLPENYSGIVLIRKEIQYGEIDQLLSVSASSIDISNLIINLTSESLEISNGRFVEADDITFVNGLLGKDENAFIGSADKPFSAIYGNLKGTAETASALAQDVTLWGQTFDGTNNVTGNISSVGNITPLTNNASDIGEDNNHFANIYATTFHGALEGTATSATKLAPGKTLWGQLFDGTDNVSGALSDANGLTPTNSGTSDIGSDDKKYKDLYLSGTASATTFIGDLTGIADSAKKLKDSKELWGHSFNGTETISGSMKGVDGITPSSSGTSDIGSVDNKYKDLYLSGSLHTGTLEATGDSTLKDIDASSLTLSGNGTINGTLKVLGTESSIFSGNINAPGKKITAQTFAGSLEGTASSASRVSNKLTISVTNNQNPADNKTIEYDGSEELSLSLIFQPLTSEDIAELGIFTTH